MSAKQPPSCGTPCIRQREVTIGESGRPTGIPQKVTPDHFHEPATIWSLTDQGVARSADDDMFGELDPQAAGESRELFRRRDIRFARGGVATGMIMDEYNRRRVEFQRSFEDNAGIEDELSQAALLQLLVRYELACRIKKQNSQHLLREAPHRRLQICNQFRIISSDRTADQICSLSFDARCPGSQNESRDLVSTSESAPKRFGFLRHDTIEAAEFFEQPIRYLKTCGRLDCSDEGCQD